MQIRQWPWVAPAPLVLIGVVLLPTAAMGQVTLGQLIPPVEKAAGKPAEGFYVTPSLSIGQLYDDNLFFSPTDRKQDFFTRVSPGIQTGYQSTPLTLLGGYTFDSEFYSKHQELNTIQMRQQSLVQFKAMPTQMLTLSAKGTFAKSRAPWEFNTFTGAAIRRVIAERLAFNPSVAYQFDPLTRGTGDYTFSDDSIRGGIRIDSHILRLDLDRKITPRDSVGLGYIGRQFEFGGFETTTSHAPMLSWKHTLTPSTEIALQAGPRFTEGSLDDRPEALAWIRHRLPLGALSLTYSSAQTTIIGTPGRVTTESLGVSATYELLPYLLVTIAPAVIKITSETFKTTMYFSNVELSYQLTKSLALKGSHQFSLMSGNLNPLSGPGAGDVEIFHNMLWLRLVVTYPSRWQ